MPIWNKYTKIKEINYNSNIKTYLVRIEPILKEIIPKDINDYFIIKQRIEILKNKYKIYDIIEENEKIYIVIDKEINIEIDKIILSNELDIKKEGIIEGHGKPITKKEILNLFEMEKSMCKISFENIESKVHGKGSGFFCEINNFPFKYALFTNNHILNKSSIEVDNIIKFEYYKGNKEIEIKKNRRVYTNKELDYTCIEIFKSDGIKNYFKIEPKIFKYNKEYLKNEEIYILQYPNGNDISFSNGKILLIKENKIFHNVSTECGSSGSPIIRRYNNKYIIGLHFGGIKKDENNYLYNLATPFDLIINDIINPINEIKCIYIIKDNEKEINLLHDYNENIEDWSEDGKKLYLEAKELNKKLFEENIELFVNEKKIKFNFKYKINNELKEINVKFKFKTILKSRSFMLRDCSYNQ